MKVSKLMLCGACALALAACSVDEVTQVNDSDAIKFKAVVPYSTRAVATTTNSLEGFTVWAWTDGGVFMDHVTAVGNGSGAYTTSPLYFWPSTAVDFLGISPVADGYDGDVVYFGGSVAADVEGGDEYYTGHVAEATVGATGIGGSVKVDVPSDHADQIDLCYAVATGKSSGSVAMNFRHALSQVVFAARNTNASLGVEVGGVSVCSVYKTGLFTLPEVSTGESLADETVGTAGIADSQGEWELGGEYSKASFRAGIDGVVSVPEDGTSVDLTASNGALFMIPQEVEGWDVAGDSHLEGFGAYFRISCRIYENGVQFWPNASEAADADGFAEIAVPVDVVWEQGYKYTYTFVFGDGAGYYPPDDPNHSGDLDGSPVLVPITFTVSVDEFQRTDGVDVGTDVEGDDNDEGDGDGDDDDDDDGDEPLDDIIPYLPDLDFEEYALENFDLDGDGHVSSEEAAQVTSITCHTVTDFTGLEYFPNLTKFTSYSVETVDFSGNTKLTAVVLSEKDGRFESDLQSAPIRTLDLSKNTKITSLSRNAFNGCANLESVSLPNSVTQVGEYLFSNCTNLTKVELPLGLTSLSNCIFYGCTSLGSITLPAGLTEIPQNAFYQCSALKYIEIPEGVTSIELYAFSQCASLSTVKLSEKLETMGNYVFYYSGLTSVELPAATTSIGVGCFQGCSDLEAIDFSKSGLTSLPTYLCSGCSSLVSISFPSTLETIAAFAFRTCSSLKSIVLPDTVTSMGTSVLSYCSALESAVLPKGLVTLSDYTFSNCSSLTSLTLPETLTKIGTYAFSNCSSLPSIEIPASVAAIDDYAFVRCYALTKVTEYATTPPTLGEKVFTNIASGSYAPPYLYVPKGCVDIYIEAGWNSYFKNFYGESTIREME